MRLFGKMCVRIVLALAILSTPRIVLASAEKQGSNAGGGAWENFLFGVDLAGCTQQLMDIQQWNF